MKNSPVKKIANSVLDMKEDKMKRTMSYRGYIGEIIIISVYNKLRTEASKTPDFCYLTPAPSSC